MHVAVAQVHPVGERVRELRRDRADLAAQPAEVVEQPHTLRGQFVEQGREAEHVHVRPMIAHASIDRRG